jgi:hypothetical protein
MTYCIKHKAHVGYDMVHNFCNGTTYRVDWTVWNWLFAGFATVATIVMIAMAVTLTVMFIRMVWQDIRRYLDR